MSYDPTEHGALCHLCPLQGRTVVPSEGPDEPDILIVGEAPGDHEVRRRRPFVGPSGERLDRWLEIVGSSRSRVAISNAILCRPEVPGLKTKERFDVKTYIAWLQTENKRRRKEDGPAARLLKSPFECCRPRLLDELRAMEEIAKRRGQPNGAVIVPVGNFAIQAVIGKKKTQGHGIMRLRGSPIPTSLEELNDA